MRNDRPVPGPSQIWVIEQAPARALAGLDRDAVAHANVVIYDRALEAVVAAALAPGGYAEPLAAPCPEARGALSPRAVQFAAEGWSVVQVVEKSPCWQERLAQAPQQLSAGSDPALRLVARDGRRHVFASAAAGKSATPPYPFTANGLAG